MMTNEEKVKNDELVKITNKLIFHSTEIALAKKALKLKTKVQSLIDLIISDRTKIVNSAVDLQLREKIEKHLKASRALAGKLIIITELVDIIDPDTMVPFGAIDLNRGYAELVAISEKNNEDFIIYTYNLSYATITKGEYKGGQDKPYCVIKNTTIKNLLSS